MHLLSIKRTHTHTKKPTPFLKMVALTALQLNLSQYCNAVVEKYIHDFGCIERNMT